MREYFKIPASLDASYFDLEFYLGSASGVGLKKPVSAKTVMIVLFSMMLWLYIIFSSFVQAGGAIVIILFTLMWIWLTYLLAKTDLTKRTGIELVPTIFNYFAPSSRQIQVRLLDPVSRLRLLTGILNVDSEDALVRFTDGTIGYVYSVVGSASILMFDGDKREILNRVDTFYRKMPVNVEIIYETLYESQQTDHQINHIQSLYEESGLDSALRNSPGIETLFQEQYNILRYGVGDKFKSSHQYMIVKAKSDAHLDEFEGLLRSEIEADGNMFKQARALSYDETCEFFHGVFGQ